MSHSLFSVWTTKMLPGLLNLKWNVPVMLLLWCRLHCPMWKWSDSQSLKLSWRAQISVYLKIVILAIQDASGNSTQFITIFRRYSFSMWITQKLSRCDIRTLLPVWHNFFPSFCFHAKICGRMQRLQDHVFRPSFLLSQETELPKSIFVLFLSSLYMCRISLLYLDVLKALILVSLIGDKPVYRDADY